MTYKLVVIGASLGSSTSLQALLAGLPETFLLPLVIVHHYNSRTPNELRAELQNSSVFPLIEPNDKEPILSQRVYFAPADYHLMVEPGSFSLSTEAPVLDSRPSINVLFESVANAYGATAIGIILVGSSKDGAEGIVKIKAAAGGVTISEDPVAAHYPVMSHTDVAQCVVDHVLAIDKIASFLTVLCRQTTMSQDYAC